MSTNWSIPTRYIAGVGLALLAILVLYLSRSVIPLLIIAVLVAVIVRPLILWLHLRARLPRGLAVAIVYLVVAILVPLALALAIPAIVDAVRYVLTLDYQTILQNIIESLRSTLTSIKIYQFPLSGVDLYIDQTADALLAQLGSGAAAPAAAAPASVPNLLQSFGTALTTTFRTAAGVVGTVISSITLILFTFLASIYVSLSAHTFYDTFMGSIPARFHPEVAILLARLGRTWGSFFRGQLTLMLVIGVITWLGLTILGVRGAPYLGIVAGLLEVIPSLGPVIATIPAVIVALLEGSTYLPVSQPIFALLVVLLYVLIQQMENNLIVPRVLGDAVDLPALVVITGVLVGADVFGLLGALLATPVIASMREIVRYVYRKILGEAPFTENDEVPKPAPRPSSGPRDWLPRGLQWRKLFARKAPRETAPPPEADSPAPQA